MKREKVAFLIEVLGAERTEALLARLPVMEKALMDAGVGWKEVSAMDAGALKAICSGGECAAVGFADTVTEVVAVAVPAGPVTFQEAETEAEVLEEGYEVESLLHTFRVIFDNIMAAPPESGEKIQLLTVLLEELQTRLGQVGEKALAISPAAPYVSDLVAASGAKSVDEGVAAVKELQGPASGIVAALLTGGAVQG